MRRNSYSQFCPHCREYTHEVFRSHSYCANCGHHGDEFPPHTSNTSPVFREIVKDVDEGMRRLERML